MKRKTILRPAPGRAFTLLAGALFLAALLVSGGCSLGYRNLHPDEDSALYGPVFQDIITRFDSPEWLWTRGALDGDFDADGTADEEAIIATIQAGKPGDPGPILEAYLAICNIEADGTRTAIARTRLFDSNPIDPAEKVANNAHPVTAAPLKNARAQIVEGKLSLSDSIAVYFWDEARPANVWATLYKLENNLLVKKMDIALCQETPGFIQSNLDRRIDPNTPGYQLVLSSAGLPREVIAKMGDNFTPPLWGHVFSPDRNGNYSQADEKFGVHYERVENSWNQAYIEASLLRKLDDADLAWFEYHLSLINFFTGNSKLARTFLHKAAAGARDPNLRTAIDAAAALIEKTELE